MQLINHCINFRPVASRDDHIFEHAFLLGELFHRRTEFRFRKRELFADFYRGGFIVDANDYDLHDANPLIDRIPFIIISQPSIVLV